MMDREKMDEEIKTMNKIWREKWKTRKPERLDEVNWKSKFQFQ